MAKIREKVVVEPVIKKDTSLAKVLTSSFWDIGQETIYFDYLGKKIGFGKQLSNSESKQLASIFKDKLKKYKKA